MSLRLLIVIPAYNEEGSLKEVVHHLIDSCPQYDYVVINDGSKDHTRDICEEEGFNYINQRANLGLAGTFQTGMRYAAKHGYDAVLQFDADGQHQPQYIEAMLGKLEEGYDIVIGSRFVTEKKPHTMRMFGSNLIQGFIRIFTGKTVRDPTSGMRMYGKRVIRLMAYSINMPPEPDTVAYLIRCGAKVSEVQVEMKERMAGQSYLTAWKSAKYMANVCISIIFVMGFRRKYELEDSAV